MEEEGHHHLVLANAYIKAFLVEIPPHESTLYHRHDLPYVSLPPPPLADGPSTPVASNAGPRPAGPRVSYALGGFSHSVNNTADVTLRNIAIELLRPQGPARNRCAEVIRGQSLENCVTVRKRSSESSAFASSVETLFETDEISVGEWELAPGSTIAPADAHLSTLVGGLSGIEEVTAEGDSRLVPQAGLVWLLAGSKTTLKSGPSGGHFVAIKFKDSGLASSR